MLVLSYRSMMKVIWSLNQFLVVSSPILHRVLTRPLRSHQSGNVQPLQVRSHWNHLSGQSSDSIATGSKSFTGKSKSLSKPSSSLSKPTFNSAERVPSSTDCDSNLSPMDQDILLAKFGVLTDVQYADSDDKPAHYDPTKTRYYRASLNHVAHAFDHWDKEADKPSFVLQFGDIIDGLNKRTNGLDPLEAITRTLATFEAHPTIPTFHAVGNHELYNFKRAEIAGLFRDSLINRTKVKTDLMGLKLDFDDWTSQSGQDNFALYYKFNPSSWLKVIALDCFEISVIGYDPSHENYLKAEEILFKYHGHKDFDLWDIDDHLNEGPEKRFQQQNGAVSEEQLAWLAAELEESESKGQKVVVFGHVCLHPDSCDWSCLLWNYDKVIEVFHKYNCVISYMSGHAHKFGHSVDEKGIHYLVYHGVIETSPSMEAFATVSLYQDSLRIQGYGSEKSLNLPIAPVKPNPRKDPKILTNQLPGVENETSNCSPSAVKVQV